MKLIKSVAPHLPIHGSTQMSITSAQVSPQSQLAAFEARAGSRSGQAVLLIGCLCCDAQGAKFAQRHGVSRVVLGRELSVKEIAMVLSHLLNLAPFRAADGSRNPKVACGSLSN